MSTKNKDIVETTEVELQEEVDLNVDDIELDGSLIAEDVEALAALIIEEMEAGTPVDLQEDLDALIGDQENLTEEFRGKAQTIFESAVSAKVSAVITGKTEEIKTLVEEHVGAMQADLETKMDKYLTYVVEEWTAQNDEQITLGVRTKTAEGFMQSLKECFTAHYITMPEGKEDVLANLEEQLTLGKTDLEKTQQDLVESQEMVTELQRTIAFRDASEGMADTEVEKLRELTEGIEFVDTDTFVGKIKTIKESYFKEEKEEKVEEPLIEQEDPYVARVAAMLSSETQ